MRFEWDEHKNRLNHRKHGVSFETAAFVFADPFALTQRDSSVEDEERWICIGAIEPGLTLLVVHAFYEEKRRSYPHHFGSRHSVTRKESL